MNLIIIPHSKEAVTNLQLSTEHLLIRMDGVRNTLLPLVEDLPWAEESGGPQSMQSQKVRHD